MVSRAGQARAERAFAVARRRDHRVGGQARLAQLDARLVAGQVDDVVGVHADAGRVGGDDVQPDALRRARRDDEPADLARILDEVRRAVQLDPAAARLRRDAGVARLP